MAEVLNSHRKRAIDVDMARNEAKETTPINNEYMDVDMRKWPMEIETHRKDLVNIS